MKEKIFILGKSTFALSVILDMLHPEFSEAGLVSNIPDEENESLPYAYQSPTIILTEYGEEEILDWQTSHFIIGSIGRSRKKIAAYFIQKFNIPEINFIPLIHRSSVTGNGFNYGVGLHISPLSVLAPFCVFGKFVVINRGVNIGHHTILHDYVTINPGVTISGICEIGENTSIGSGAILIDNVKIGKNSVIGAGSVVTKNIPDGVIAYGSPAKVIRENDVAG